MCHMQRMQHMQHLHLLHKNNNRRSVFSEYESHTTKIRVGVHDGFYTSDYKDSGRIRHLLIQELLQFQAIAKVGEVCGAIRPFYQ